MAGFKKKRHVFRCKFCDAPIDFVKAPGKKPIPVDAKREYFVPDAAGGAVYVSQDGMVQKGRSHPDGMVGYHLHTCGRSS